MKTQLLKTGGVLLVAVALAVGGFIAWQVLQPEPTITATGGLHEHLQPATYQRVRALESSIQQDDERAATLARLGYAYLQSARESGDGTFVEKAQNAFEHALDLDPQNVEAAGGMGMIHLKNHAFREALRWGQRSLEQNPHRAATYGILVDAYIELGRYDQAISTAQTMVDRRPDLASYSRVSYLRELHGDLEGAIDAMQRAVSAGSGSLEKTNWARVQLGHLYFQRGDLQRADRMYQVALHQMPDYGRALAGRGQVALARGAFDKAVSYYERAVDAFPIPEYVIALAGAYEAAGQTEAATARYDEAVEILRDERASAMDVDEELALLLLQQDRDRAWALELAQGAYERRPTVKNASILAWAHHENGRHGEALQYANESLRLGTKDAVFYYRAGLIARAAGETKQARHDLHRALDLNPHFSVRGALEANRALAAL